MLSEVRYTQRPFPPYRFVPGQTPHPTRDPRGHSYRATEERWDSFDANQWNRCQPYLYGVDLFNHRYWWEAHEAWEVIWRAAGRRTLTGLFLQGLIQASVAQLKRSQGRNRSARRLVQDARRKLSLVSGTFLGIEVSSFLMDLGRNLQDENPPPLVIRLSHPTARDRP